MQLRLKEWRERRLLTQAELAARVGVTVGTVNRIERGVHRPRFATVRKLAEALGVGPDDLVVWNGGGVSRSAETLGPSSPSQNDHSKGGDQGGPDQDTERRRHNAHSDSGGDLRSGERP